jgi:hypothetical protein
VVNKVKSEQVFKVKSEQSARSMSTGVESDAENRPTSGVLEWNGVNKNPDELDRNPTIRQGEIDTGYFTQIHEHVFFHCSTFTPKISSHKAKNSSPQDRNRAMFTRAAWREERLDSGGRTEARPVSRADCGCHVRMDTSAALARSFHR